MVSQRRGPQHKLPQGLQGERSFSQPNSVAEGEVDDETDCDFCAAHGAVLAAWECGSRRWKDADTDVAGDASRIRQDGTTEADAFRCEVMPPGPYYEAGIWENNLWGLMCHVFDYLGPNKLAFVTEISRKRQIAVYVVGTTLVRSPWPLNVSVACMPGIRLLTVCPK